MQPHIPAVDPIPKCQDDEYAEVAWGKENLDGKFSAFNIPRPKVFGKQVKFEMLYCGICHSDCHMGLNHWNNANFPFVPGHELLGKVVEVGPEVTKFKLGETVGVGCFVDSCGECESCKSGFEQYCYKGMTGTYGAPKVHGRVGGNPKLRTFGGYTGSNVVHEDYVLKIPEDMDKEKTAPILCAGITMYSPLANWNCLEGGKTVGIVGIGGLGTMGIKIAKAMGNKVVAISTSNKKEAMAKAKGADVFVVSKDADSIKANVATCDVILNTVSADHDLNTYLPLLKKQSTLVQLGGVTSPHSIVNFPLMINRWSVAGSLIGGVKECQDCIDFCYKHSIYPDCETIEANKIDWAWDQLLGEGGNPDGIRYVIDIKKSLQNESFLPAKE